MATPDFGGLLGKSRGPMAAPEVEPLEDPADEDAGVMERVTPIAEDLVAAIRGGDTQGVAEALIAAHKACASGPSDAYPEDEEV